MPQISSAITITDIHNARLSIFREFAGDPVTTVSMLIRATGGRRSEIRRRAGSLIHLICCTIGPRAPGSIFVCNGDSAEDHEPQYIYRITSEARKLTHIQVEHDSRITHEGPIDLYFSRILRTKPLVSVRGRTPSAYKDRSEYLDAIERRRIMSEGSLPPKSLKEQIDEERAADPSWQNYREPDLTGVKVYTKEEALARNKARRSHKP